MFKTVNLEVNYPTVDEAMRKLKKAIKDAVKGDCLLFIHGYGSTGKGGAIKKETRAYLSDIKNKGEIHDIIKGEEFSITTGLGYNYEAIRLRTQYKELEQYAYQRNQGVTVIVK